MKQNILGTRIADLRRKKNWTQQELATKLQMSTSSIAMWEVGKRDPDSDMLAKLASLFDVSTDYLLGRTNDPTTIREVTGHDQNLGKIVDSLARARDLDDEDYEVIADHVERLLDLIAKQKKKHSKDT